MCTQNRYRSSFRDLLCLINSFCYKCQLPFSPGSSIPVEGVAEQVGSRWAQGSAFFVWFPFSSCLSSTIFLLLCFEGLTQDCPALSKPIAGACSGEQPQPDPRSLNQQVLPVTACSIIGLKNRWIRKPVYKKDRNKENIYAKLVVLQFLNFIKFSLSVVLQS